MEDEEALETITVVRKAADLVHNGVDHLLAHSVVATGVCSKWSVPAHASWHRDASRTVARGILLASDKGFGVEKTPVGPGADLVDNVGLEVDVKRAGHVLARRGLREESAEAIVVSRG